ncbi:MAG: hypothetical protein WC767_03815, partial [Candidatus Paceibacterota bacterium]
AHLPVAALILLGAGCVFVPAFVHAATIEDVAIGIAKIATTPAVWFNELLAGALHLVVGTILKGVLFLVSGLLDFVLQVSLTSNYIYDSAAVNVGWSIFRDICNIIFIFFLIFTGIQTILGLQNINTKQIVMNVIIAAVLINFSLYITKFAIDLSNIFAGWFMQGIANLTGGASVGESLRTVLSLNKLDEFGGASITNSSLLRVAVIMLPLRAIAIYVIFKVAFLFLGRTISFVFLLITAPIGFVGHLVGPLKEYAKKWRDDLAKDCFMAPIFLLLLYITLYFADTINTTLETSKYSLSIDPFTETSFGPANYILFALVAMLLLKSLSVAEEYSSDAAAKIGGVLKSATMLAVGAGATRIIGGAGVALSQSKYFANQATYGSNALVRGTAKALMLGGGIAAKQDFGIKEARKGLMLDKTPLKESLKGAEKGYEGDVKAYVKSEQEFVKPFNAQQKIDYAKRLAGKESEIKKTATLGGNLVAAKPGGLLGKIGTRVAGAPIGASAGAILGGTIGSVLGPAGTVAGGALGGVVGGVVGGVKGTGAVVLGAAGQKGVTGEKGKIPGIKAEGVFGKSADDEAKKKIEEEGKKELAKDRKKSAEAEKTRTVGIFDEEIKDLIGDIAKATEKTAEQTKPIVAEIANLAAEQNRTNSRFNDKEKKVKDPVSGEWTTFNTADYEKKRKEADEAVEKIKKDIEAARGRISAIEGAEITGMKSKLKDLNIKKKALKNVMKEEVETLNETIDEGKKVEKGEEEGKVSDLLNKDSEPKESSGGGDDGEKK